MIKNQVHNFLVSIFKIFFTILLLKITDNSNKRNTTRNKIEISPEILLISAALSLESKIDYLHLAQSYLPHYPRDPVVIDI